MSGLRAVGVMRLSPRHPRGHGLVAVWLSVSPEEQAMLRAIAARSELSTATILRALIRTHRNDTIRIEQRVEFDVTVEAGKEGTEC